MSLAALLKVVVEILDGSSIPYMLTGSIVGAYYAQPRSTQDLDFVVEVDSRAIDQVVRDFQARGLYVSETAAQEALRHRGLFNAIDPRTGWKVDLIVRKDRPFSIMEFSRRRTATVLGVQVSLASIEDLILAKLEWAKLGDSALQRRDVLQLVQAGWSSLDRAYVERWSIELGVNAEWSALVDQLSEANDDS